VGGPTDNTDIGAAWVYTRSRGGWSQQAKLIGSDVLGRFGAIQGASVSLSGDGNTALVGGPFDGDQAGAAWVYTRSRGMWSQQTKLISSDALGPLVFQGYSVSLSGDGNTALVGAPFDDGTIGAAWVYARSSGVWSQQAKLVGAGATGDAQQGSSVSLSGDGNTAIVGGPSDNDSAGAAWVYTRSGRVWSQQAKLIGSGVLSPYGAAQGSSVSLSGDGNTAIVGGSFDNNLAGAAWVYTRSGGVWSQQAKLIGTGAGPFASQGFSVSLSGDGNTAIVGGPFDSNETGAAWVYMRAGSLWTQYGTKLVGTGALDVLFKQGWSVSLSSDGNTAIIGGPAGGPAADAPPGAGAAWVFAPFAGKPGTAKCHGQSIAMLVREFGGLNAAAAGVGFASIRTLQDAILGFCDG
jgi:hypothetical protein